MGKYVQLLTILNEYKCDVIISKEFSIDNSNQINENEIPKLVDLAPLLSWEDAQLTNLECSYLGMKKDMLIKVWVKVSLLVLQL